MNVVPRSQEMLDGTVALVTGGATGIGRAIAHELLAAGATVVIAGRTQARLDRAAADLASPRLVTHRCDVADERAVEAMADLIRRRNGPIGVLVCSHGIYPGTRPATDITVAEFDRVMGVNVRGSFLCARAAAAHMLAVGAGGRVIFVSSMNAIMSQAGAADYDTSKAALHGLTRALAVELSAHRITVNAIAPGWVATEMSAEELAHLEGQNLNPSHRVGEPRDIARAALWLADPGNDYVTGTVITIDGGQTAMLPLPWSADATAPPCA